MQIDAYRPQEGPQLEFHSRLEDVIGYGGSKGGAKTHGLIGEALRQVSNPKYKAILFRRTYPQLQEIIDRGRQIYGLLGAVWHGDEKRFKFPSGAWIGVGYAQYEHDVENHQGKEYDFIGIDQVEQWSKYMVDYLMGCNRGSAPGIRRYAAFTFNPGGPGHKWVKEMFIRDENGPKTPGKTYFQTFILPSGKKLTRTSVFIKSSVYDNKILLETNPTYLANLYSMPEKMRKAYLDGDFDIFEGQFFDTWRESVHVIKPFTVGPEFKIYMSMDWGYEAPLSVHWWAVPPDGQHVYCIREYYTDHKTSPVAAREIHEINLKIFGKDYISQRRIEGMYVDPSINQTRGETGKPIAEDFKNTFREVMDDGKVRYFPIIDADNDRMAGWSVFRNMLEIQPDGRPFCMWFSNCVKAIETIPGLQHDTNRVEDLDTDGEDHAADDHRYFFISRFKSRKIEPEKPYDKLTDQGSKQEWEHVQKTILSKKKPTGKLSAVGV